MVFEASSGTGGEAVRRAIVSIVFVQLLETGCGSSGPEPCEAPTGCLSVGQANGACQCLAWKTVSEELVPLKFLVTGVVSFPPGNQSGVGYGDASLLSPSGHSQWGTRLRAVVRDAQGRRTVLSVETSTGGTGQYTLTPLGETTLAVASVPGSGWGWSNVLDIVPRTFDKVVVWVNPTLRIVRDAGANQRGVWGWSGNCFWPYGVSGGGPRETCSGLSVLLLDVGTLDGLWKGYPWEDAFLATLKPAELASIRGYDRLASTPPPTTAELDVDPRFVRLGNLHVEPAGSSASGTSWTPCSGLASEEDFPVFASTEVPLSTGDALVIEQSWLTTTPSCTVQTPGLALGTSTPGCQTSSTMYIDRMFGTLAFLSDPADPACTTAP